MNRPIELYPENTHYFMYKDKPTILITSDHSYRAVMTSNWDYNKYLHTLADYDMNFTRIYPGIHVQPRDGDLLILPWAKTSDGKYDLEKWNPDYFRRLHDFMQLASSLHIIVDIVLFNGWGTDEARDYQKWWEVCPLNAINNLQGVGIKRDFLCTLEQPIVVKYEKAYVRKLVTELNQYDNLIYDIADEPDYFNKIPDHLVNAWLDVMIEEVRSAEEGLSKTHLLAETHHPTLEKGGKDWCADNRTSWISVEYLDGLGCFETEYSFNKPYVLIETTSPVYNPRGGYWLIAYGVDASRIYSWAFLVAGGAGFMEYNEDYDVANPSGGSITAKILSQKKILKEFLCGFDFTKMHRFTDFEGVGRRCEKIPTGWATAMAEPGKQYALYLNHSYIDWSMGLDMKTGPGFYHEAPGLYGETITLLNVPIGRYNIEWMDPATGAIIQASQTDHGGGDLSLKAPEYSIDIALRIDTGGRQTL